MTLEEQIEIFEHNAEHERQEQDLQGCLNFRQLTEWLRELKAYREILANADKIIESEYGCVIIEGYADVIDKMNEVFRRVNADDRN